MIEESSVQLSGNRLAFRVTDKIDYGNAVLAVFDNQGQIAWSWHIWATDYDPYATDGTKTVQNRTAPNTTFDFMTQNLGWYPEKEYAAREARIKVTQSETGVTRIITVNQPVTRQIANGTYYQWGRKDPFPGVLTGPVNKPTYGPAEYIWPATGDAPGTQTISTTSIAEYIKNPYKFNLTEGMNSAYSNLWSADNAAATVHTTKPVKTVYDPSPVEFCMPPSGAFPGSRLLVSIPTPLPGSTSPEHGPTAGISSAIRTEPVEPSFSPLRAIATTRSARRPASTATASTGPRFRSRPSGAA